MPESPQFEITEDLPDRVGGYATLEYLSLCGWKFAIVAAQTDLFTEPEVLVVGRRDGWPELTAQARSVESTAEYVGAAAKVWREAWHTLGREAVRPWRLPESLMAAGFPTSRRRSAA